MQTSRRTAVALFTTAVLAGSATPAATAVANPAPVGPLLTSTLAPSVPTDPTLHGVAAGGVPWELEDSALTLSGNGDLDVLIRGLVIPELGTAGPVKTVDAALYCGNDTTAAATTASVPLSEKGNATIATRVSLPTTCLTPVILINPNGAASAYIATSGFAKPAAATPIQPVLTTSLTPSIPADPALHGVSAGSAPWVLRNGVFRLSSNGDVQVLIQGLVIPELGTAGPVTSVDAAIYCANETAAAATTASVPLSAGGDALIATRVSLPKLCLTPVVLINPNGIGSVYIATSGFAKDRPVLNTTLAPSLPSDPVLHGVTAGSAPWVLQSSALHLSTNGDLHADIRGLVIPELGTPGPVTTVDAALYCANETTAAATTLAVPLSEKGDATITTRVSLPASCLTPVVLINPNSIGSIYIATGGFANASTTPSFVHPLLDTSLTPSVPTDPMLHGVTAGSAPWVLGHGVFRLSSTGEVQVFIRGLLIPELGTPGPVTSVDAAVYCANETTAAATTASVPLSEKGDATIRTQVSLPETCLTPVVLINPNSIGSVYITTSGFSVSS